MLRPAAARTADALKITSSPATGGSGEKTQSPVGEGDTPTDTVCTDEAETPRSLVTVSVTAKLPVAAKVCVTVFPDAEPPSPKVQSYADICVAPWPGVLADASNVAATRVPA